MSHVQVHVRALIDAHIDARNHGDDDSINDVDDGHDDEVPMTTTPTITIVTSGPEKNCANLCK